MMPNDTVQIPLLPRPEFSAGKIIRRHAARSSGKVSSSLPQAIRQARIHAPSTAATDAA
jgi:hypothetical protein